MPGFLQSVLRHEFENVLEVTAKFYGVTVPHFRIIKVWQGRRLAKQTEIQLSESARRKPVRPFLAFLDVPDPLLAVA